MRNARAKVTKGERRAVAGIVTRIMREQGFPGSVDVTSVHRRRDGGYNVAALARYAHGEARYTAVVPAPGAGTRVKITRKGDVALAA